MTKLKMCVISLLALLVFMTPTVVLRAQGATATPAKEPTLGEVAQAIGQLSNRLAGLEADKAAAPETKEQRADAVRKELTEFCSARGLVLQTAVFDAKGGVAGITCAAGVTKPAAK